MTSPRLLLALPALALAVTGCGSSTGSDSDAIQIVATTNVYGDVAQAIAGDRVEVHELADLHTGCIVDGLASVLGEQEV